MIFFVIIYYKQKKQTNQNKFMDLVKKRGSLKFHSEVTNIILKVTLLIREIPKLENLK